jgi:hypothetical protein
MGAIKPLPRPKAPTGCSQALQLRLNRLWFFVFALYQGTTLVVKFHDILYRLSLDILYTFVFLILVNRRSRRKGKWETLCVFQGGRAAVFSLLPWVRSSSRIRVSQ